MTDKILNDVERARLARSLGDIATLILSARQLLELKVPAGSFDQVDEALAAMLEKAGALSDRSLAALGAAPVVGSGDDWRSVRHG